MQQLDLKLTKCYTVQVAMGLGQFGKREVHRYEVQAMSEAEALSFLRQEFPKKLMSIVK